MTKLLTLLVSAVLSLSAITTDLTYGAAIDISYDKPVVFEIPAEPISYETSSAPNIDEEDIFEEQLDYEQMQTEEETIEAICPLTEEEINLLAIVCMAEAEGEPEEGKRLVIDTVLNRVDDAAFPDDICDVIYQPYQFSSMSNGRADICYASEDIVELVIEESINRYNSDCLYFRADYYSEYGTPLFNVGNHYFSS